SPLRTEPRCKIFGFCGGCDLQHIEIDAQRRFKEEMTLSMLERQAGLKPLEIINASTNLPSYNYRNRISLHLNEKGEVGFFKKNSGEVVDCDYCPISSEALNTGLKLIRNHTALICEKVGTIILEENSKILYLVLQLREGADNFSLHDLPSDLKNE